MKMIGMKMNRKVCLRIFNLFFFCTAISSCNPEKTVVEDNYEESRDTFWETLVDEYLDAKDIKKIKGYYDTLIYRKYLIFGGYLIKALEGYKRPISYSDFVDAVGKSYRVYYADVLNSPQSGRYVTCR